MERRSGRRSYIDWLRGVAVLIMVEAHTIDAWTHASERGKAVFGMGGVVGGFAAPLFLFLAGVAVPLAVGSKVRRGATRGEASRAAQRRGWEVFGLALVFRLQAKLLGGGGWRSLLKVDILNIMGPAIALAAAVCGACRTSRARVIVLGGLAAATALVTPVIRSAKWPAFLPEFAEAYLRPIPQLTNFVWFPWGAFVLAGALVGVVLEPLRDAGGERRANIGFAIAGLAFLASGWLGSYLPSPYAYSYFWTSSPAFFAMRIGILTLALPLAYLWSQRPTATHWSPLQQFGRTSLFVYWIHVEMVYGVLSAPLHRALTLPRWAVAYILFTGFLLVLSVGKTWVAGEWSRRKRLV